MAIGRATATAHLVATLGEIIAEAGLTATDTTGNLKEPIDAALRAVGVPYTSTATGEASDADANAFLALLEAHTLERLEAALSINFFISGGGEVYSLNQLFTNVRAMKADAFARANSALGWRSGVLTLGAFEPAGTAGTA